MNIFRFIGDHDSLINVLVLLLKINITKSWSGVSLKIQELYAMVLLARYLDLCGGHRAISHGISLKVQRKQDNLLQVTSSFHYFLKVKRSARLNLGQKNTQNRVFTCDNSTMASYSDNYSQFEDSYCESINGVDEQSLEDMFKEYSSANQRFDQDILQYQENMEQLFKNINSNFRSTETLTSKMNDIPNGMFEEEKFHVLLSCDEKETLNDVTLKSVETNEHAINEHFAIDGLTPCIYEYWSDHEESEGKLEVSQSEPEIVMAQTYEEEAEKEIEVTLTRPEELQEENKDDQSFVLVNPPTLPYIFDDFEMELDVKERSKTFCTADTFVLDDLKIIYSYVLEVQDKLLFHNKGVSVSLPNAKRESIILGYSLLKGIT
ncbi:hypothetical protein Sjap_022118 [Stephania japonica]|uniref:Uncharacterized protein n=1 Tax=Stephania japonica TaxID=461633 RepID=A0AAP0EN99_9MAGN